MGELFISLGLEKETIGPLEYEIFYGMMAFLWSG